MNSPVYFPVLWLVVAALVLGITTILAALSFFLQTVGKGPLNRSLFHRQLVLLQQMRWGLSLLALAMTGTGLTAWRKDATQKAAADAEKRAELKPQYDRSKVWEAPDPYLSETIGQAALIAYGRNLVARIQDY